MISDSLWTTEKNGMQSISAGSPQPLAGHSHHWLTLHWLRNIASRLWASVSPAITMTASRKKASVLVSAGCCNKIP